MVSNRSKANLAMLTFTLIWGTSFPLTKIALESMSVFSFLSLRFGIAAIILVLVFHRKLKLITWKTPKAGAILGIIFFFSLFFQVSSLCYTTSSNSAFVSGLSVVIVPILTFFLLRKGYELSSIFGVVLAIVGLFFITDGIAFRFGLGELLALLSALFSALQIIFIDRYSSKHEASLLGVLQIALCAIAYTALSFFVDFKPFTITFEIGTAVFVTGVLGTALAYTGQIYAQRFTSPTTVALILTAEPVFALAFALIIPISSVTETLGVGKSIGCVAILLAMIVTELRPTNARLFPNLRAMFRQPID